MDEQPCECMFCKNNKPFDLPDSLVDACIKGKVVIFAGAGVSTEVETVFPWTLYDDLLGTLNPPPTEILSFPKAASKFVEQEGRNELLKLIKERFDYLDSFPELYRSATRFHMELSTIYPLREIVTTNWDTFFEEEANAIPIVTPDDYAFWDLPYRKVFKIHGSVNNVGTIVATEKDYRACYRRLHSGIIGGDLKRMLATKTIVFVGYSFRDDDFARVYDYVKRELGDNIPHSYIVTPSKSVPAKATNSTLIHTDGTYFLAKLKEKLVERKIMLPDSQFDGIHLLRYRVIDAHETMLDNFSFDDYPELVYSSSYQDGLIHALERIISRRKSGEYSEEHHLAHQLASYERMRKGAIRQKRYFDAAYIEGYTNGILALFCSKAERKVMPLYFVFGSKQELRTAKQFERALKKASKLHVSASQKAREIVSETRGLIPQHSPFLLGVEPI